MVQMVHKVLRDHKDLKVHKDHKDLKEKLVLQVQTD